MSEETESEWKTYIEANRLSALEAMEENKRQQINADLEIARINEEIKQLQDRIAGLKNRITELQFPVPVLPDTKVVPTREELRTCPVSDLLEVLRLRGTLFRTALLAMVKAEYLYRLTLKLTISYEEYQRLAAYKRKPRPVDMPFEKQDATLSLFLAFRHGGLSDSEIVAESHHLLQGVRWHDIQVIGRKPDSDVGYLLINFRDHNGLGDILEEKQNGSGPLPSPARNLGSYLYTLGK